MTSQWECPPPGSIGSHTTVKVDGGRTMVPGRLWLLVQGPFQTGNVFVLWTAFIKYVYNMVTMGNHISFMVLNLWNSSFNDPLTWKGVSMVQYRWFHLKDPFWKLSWLLMLFFGTFLWVLSFTHCQHIYTIICWCLANSVNFNDRPTPLKRQMDLTRYHFIVRVDFSIIV